jgi:penicillin V acylase-like amidase (Ntn superfamily)
MHLYISKIKGATVDGMKEKGLVAKLLYLKEAEWGDATKSGKPTLTVGAWAQYFLDNFAIVGEAIAAMANSPFTILAPPLPKGYRAGLHLSLSDATGDSAILEYINGKLVIHHGSQYRVMTNSPTFDQQLALNVYSVFSQVRMISVPLGLADSSSPNIAMTLWRTVADCGGSAGEDLLLRVRDLPCSVVDRHQ